MKKDLKSKYLRLPACKSLSDHEFGWNTIGGFEGHLQVHPVGFQICLKCRKTLQEVVDQILGEVRFLTDDLLPVQSIDEKGEKHNSESLSAGSYRVSASELGFVWGNTRGRNAIWIRTTVGMQIWIGFLKTTLTPRNMLRRHGRLKRQRKER